MPPDQEVKTEISNRYRLTSEIGSGGMGTVWHGEDSLLKRDVAVKEIALPRAVQRNTATTQAEPAVVGGHAAVHEGRGELQHPPNVLGRHEMPGRTQDVRAHDRSPGERVLDVVVGR